MENAKRIEKDGWRIIAGYEVYVEDGKIRHGVKDSYTGIGQVSTYVYRASRYGGWDREYSGVTVAAFRAGVRRGTISML